MPWRKIVFWAHLIAGVTAGLVIFTVAVTGTLLAFEPQIVDWAERGVRMVAPPSADAPRLSLDELASAAQKEKPKAKVTSVTVNFDPLATVAVGFGRNGSLYLNPYTGAVLGSQSKVHDFLHTVEDIHRYLGNRDIGKPITGASVVFFFFLLVSGLYIWNSKQVFVFNGRLSGKARDWNWHNVFGIWLSPLILVTTVTGMIMAHAWATNLLYRATGTPPPPANQPQQRGDRSEAPIPLAALDAFATAAAGKVPSWKSIVLRLPQKPEAPVNATILESEPSFGIPVRSQLTMDALTAEEKKWEPFSEANRGRAARVWARYVHTGEAGGIPGQMLAFLSACGVLVLVWTGLAMAWRRFRC